MDYGEPGFQMPPEPAKATLGDLLAPEDAPAASAPLPPIENTPPPADDLPALLIAKRKAIEKGHPPRRAVAAGVPKRRGDKTTIERAEAPSYRLEDERPARYQRPKPQRRFSSKKAEDREKAVLPRRAEIFVRRSWRCIWTSRGRHQQSNACKHQQRRCSYGRDRSASRRSLSISAIRSAFGLILAALDCRRHLRSNAGEASTNARDLEQTRRYGAARTASTRRSRSQKTRASLLTRRRSRAASYSKRRTGRLRDRAPSTRCSPRNSTPNRRSSRRSRPRRCSRRRSRPRRPWRREASPRRRPTRRRPSATASPPRSTASARAAPASDLTSRGAAAAATRIVRLPVAAPPRIFRRGLSDAATASRGDGSGRGRDAVSPTGVAAPPRIFRRGLSDAATASRGDGSGRDAASPRGRRIVRRGLSRTNGARGVEIGRTLSQVHQAAGEA